MNRRTFLKVATITTVGIPALAIAKKEPEWSEPCTPDFFKRLLFEDQWINVDLKMPPLNADIAVLKLATPNGRKVSSIYVGKLVERIGDSFVYITPKISQTTVENYDGRENYYRVEKKDNYDKKIEQLLIDNYAKGRCVQNDNYWQHISRLGFHMLNTDRLRTYWTYADKIPKELP